MSKKDEEWIENATLPELQEAIETEPIDSELFMEPLASLFWSKMGKLIRELYGARVE